MRPPPLALFSRSHRIPRLEYALTGLKQKERLLKIPYPFNILPTSAIFLVEYCPPICVFLLKNTAYLRYYFLSKHCSCLPQWSFSFLIYCLPAWFFQPRSRNLDIYRTFLITRISQIQQMHVRSNRGRRWWPHWLCPCKGVESDGGRKIVFSLPEEKTWRDDLRPQFHGDTVISRGLWYLHAMCSLG